MKNYLKLLSLLIIVFMFCSCEEEEEPCEGEVTTFSLPDGTTRSVQQPCFD